MSALADYTQAREMVRLAVTKAEKEKWELRAQQALDSDKTFETTSGKLFKSKSEIIHKN